MFYRKIKHGSRLQSFPSLESAIADKSTSLEAEILQGDLQVMGEIQTVMVPTRTLAPGSKTNGCTMSAPKRPCRDEDDEDFEHA